MEPAPRSIYPRLALFGALALVVLLLVVTHRMNDRQDQADSVPTVSVPVKPVGLQEATQCFTKLGLSVTPLGPTTLTVKAAAHPAITISFYKSFAQANAETPNRLAVANNTVLSTSHLVTPLRLPVVHCLMRA